MRDRWLWLATLAYAALLTWLGAIKYAAHRNLVDFGIFEQTAASAFGCFCNAVEGSHWAFHFSPILYVAGAAVALWHSPLALIALQALAGALTIPPIYALVLRKRGDVGSARLAGAVVLLYPPLAGLIFGDFHENGFAPAAVAWALYLFDAGRLWWSVLAALAAIAVKEDQAAFIAVAGFLGWWRFRGTMPGLAALAVAVVAALAFAQYFEHVAPHAAVLASWQPVRFYAWTAQDVRALFPAGLAQRAGFLVLVFAPLLFLPFRSRMLWLAAAPLGEVLLSRMPTTFTLGSHYAGAWLGYVLAAFAFAVRALPPARGRVLLWWCIGLCVVELAVADPLHPGLNLRAPQSRDAALDRYLRALPPNLDVATQEEAYTHLALRDPNATVLPERAGTEPNACYLLIDRAFPDSPRLQEYGTAIAALVARGRYAPAGRAGGIELYRRTGCR
ncbi:MAG TPA: DUF2079 domain-containing protein [Verrucomicrobiae bacterium]|nr:DUF2079 domain-containing protein [Verrucomicrobiae bacterium]